MASATATNGARAIWQTQSFNPHPPLMASATPFRHLLPMVDEMFQSSPAPDGECNQAARVGGSAGLIVSILTRP